MNCRICQKESDNYRGGKLSGDLKYQVEAHLHNCSECAEIYRIETMADTIIDQEKTMSPAADLPYRIMSKIGNHEGSEQKVYLPVMRVLKPALITTLMAAAISIGVMIGNIYKPSANVNSKPVELALIDDAAMESIDILSNE
jgi:predicted anti-sigma-YlaC factor YlaD